MDSSSLLSTSGEDSEEESSESSLISDGSLRSVSVSTSATTSYSGSDVDYLSDKVFIIITM